MAVHSPWRWRTPAFLAALAALAAAAIHDARSAAALPGGWTPSGLDWLLAAALLVLLAYGAVPLARDRQLTVRRWRRLRSDPWATAATAYLLGFLVVGTVGPLVVGEPTSELAHAYQPPAFTTTGTFHVPECLGPVADGRCHGTLRYPLGTNGQGEGLVRLTVAGARVALQVALVASLLLVPLATLVGVVAGYRGGWVDTVLMRYVDVQQTVPAFLVYLVLVFVFGRSLFLVVVVFGLFSWGGAARLVRADVLQRRDQGFVGAAAAFGAGDSWIARRHLLPSVSGTVAVAATRQAPSLILVEAALAFMKLTPSGSGSWGELIAFGMDAYFPARWWISTVPVAALVATVLAFGVFGDALRDVLDPRAST